MVNMTQLICEARNYEPVIITGYQTKHWIVNKLLNFYEHCRQTLHCKQTRDRNGENENEI